MEDSDAVSLPIDPTKEELRAKYEQAMKLLGKKELENAMLRNLLKKPHFDPNGLKGNSPMGIGGILHYQIDESYRNQQVPLLLPY